jgi:ABC-type Zn uptake system ZnuABC Zn-binding protein ZnuA
MNLQSNRVVYACAGIRWIVTVGLVAMWVVALGGCDEGDGPGGKVSEVDRYTIVASIFPLGSLAEQLVGSDAEVVTLLSAGASEHGVELTAAQIATLTEADLLIVVGMGLDEWAVRAAENTGRSALPVFRFEETLAPENRPPEGVAGEGDEGSESSGEGGGFAHRHQTDPRANPHVWLDPVLTNDFVKRLSGKLIAMRPDLAEAIGKRTESLVEELDGLDRVYRARLGAAPQKNLVIFHNAFDRLADRYGIRVVTHLTDLDLSPGGEITPGRLVEVLNAIAYYRLQVVYSEAQFPESTLTAIREQTGVAILRLDPLGGAGIAGHQTYQAMMNSNLETLVQGQSITPTRE